MKFRVALLLILLIPLPGRGVDYRRDIRPLLQENCYNCHAGERVRSGYRLDTGAGAIRGGDRGAVVVPGEPEASVLLDILRGEHDSVPRMPYKNPALAPEEIDRIARWIAEGASVPEDEVAVEHRHWSFRVPERPPVPAAADPGWEANNPVDRFIQARLIDKGLVPSPEAPRATLIRRICLDVTGIPPSPEEVERFEGDEAPDAVERLAEMQLASPHHGERWGRHWLDTARYADSNGYSIDGPRSIWPYRDWVVRAMNEDMPFDRFIEEQLAGDLLSDPHALVATGFHRNTQINQEGGIDPEQFRVEAVVDRVATTGTAFLGLTLACAQCHDHKFDPVTQEEYYRFFAFFNNQDEPNHEFPLPREIEAREEHRRKVEAVRSRLRELESGMAEGEILPGLDEDCRALLAIASERRTRQQRSRIEECVGERLPEWRELSERLTGLMRQVPRVTTSMVLRERVERPRTTHVHIKGDFTRKGDPVSPGVPGVLHPIGKAENRLDLARWLAARDNPLTARVMVNRIWQQYFGRGLVETENDFGTQGSPPSHPDLLDWLAVELMDNGWSLKHIHRLILGSRTYRQSSVADPERQRRDPANKWLARQSRLRLESEIIRDAALSASGLLSGRIGGPSVHPPQPPGVMNLGQVRRQWSADQGEDRYRRGLYTFFWRATPHPALTVFDSPDGFSACSRRIRSNTPLQALTLLNDPAYHEIATGFARRIAALETGEDGERLRHAFALCTGRRPTNEEFALLQESLEGRGEEKWTFLARVLLNLDETITRE